MLIGIFEDYYVKYFGPLIYTRPIFELRSGAFTLRQRMEYKLRERGFDRVDLLIVREYLAEPYSRILREYKVNEIYEDEDLLLINARLVMTEEIKRLLDVIKDRDVVVLSNEEILMIRLGRRLLHEVSNVLTKPIGDEFLKFIKTSVEIVNIDNVSLVRAPWDLIDMNLNFLNEDLSKIPLEEYDKIGDKVFVAGDIGKYVTFDDSKGPIVIERGAIIEDFSCIKGPVYIAKDVNVDCFTKISDSSIGFKSKVSGLIEQTIVQGRSDIMPYSYVRTSYLGEWVMIGSNCALCDIKMTLGSIKIRTEGMEVDTGFMELGSLIGDLARLASGTIVYPGKAIGVSAFVSGVVNDNVPSFMIWSNIHERACKELSIDKIIEVYKRSAYLKEEMPSFAYIDILRKVYERMK